MNCETVNLKKGSKGSLVVELQTKLKKDKLYTAAIDGEFGTKTENAVKALQKRNGNSQDGLFGPKTCNKAGYGTPIANSTPSSVALEEIYCDKVNIKSGTKNGQVATLQAKLINKGYKNVKQSGISDNNTILAIKELQRKQGNSMDGHFGPKTCNKTGWFKASNPSTTTPSTGSSNSSTTTTTLPKSKILPIYVFDQQDAISCGPTSSCMAFSYYDVVNKSNFLTSKKKIMQLAGTGNNGTDPNELVKAITKFNSNFEMKQFAYDGMPIIKKYIGNNNPCVLHINTTPALSYNGVYGHYIICTGYNENDNTIRIADPSRTNFGARFVPINWITQAIRSRNAPLPVKPLIKK